MGIHSRYSAAFLVLALISPQVFSAVRVPVIQNNEYIRQVLSKQTASTGAVTTPAGDVAFYGAEKVFSFSAGDSVRPTVREVVSTFGTPSYPYGPGAAYPNDPNLTPSAATKVKVKPQVVVPKSNILSALKTGIKSNPVQLALTATVAAAVAGVGWIIDEGSQAQPIKKPIPQPSVDPTTGSIYWCWQNSQGNCIKRVSSVSAAQQAYVDDLNTRSDPGHRTWVPNTVTRLSETSYRFTVKQTSSGDVFTSYAGRYGTCPTGWLVDGGYCPGSSQQAYESIGDADLSTLDPWVSQQSAEWLSGLIRDVCNGSPNPGGCFSQMADRSKGMIQGPATLQGPVTSKTTSTTNPDGSISTRTETTSTKYDFQYSNNYFDVDTEKKTTTTVDGEPVSETIENDNTPPEEAPDPTEQPEEPEPEYTFEDSPFPEVEPFYQQKYPDGLQGVWDQAKADIDNSNFLSFLRSFVPSFSGSCPGFGMSFAIGNMANFGSHDFASLCYIFDFVKIVLLVTAVFTARQITFGG